MKAYWVNGGIAPRILDLSTRWRWVVSFTPRQPYRQGKSPVYPLDRWLGGPHWAGLDAVSKRKIPSPCRDSNPQRYTTELPGSQCVWNRSKAPCILILGTGWNWVIKSKSTVGWSASCWNLFSREKPEVTWKRVFLGRSLCWLKLPAHNISEKTTAKVNGVFISFPCKLHWPQNVFCDFIVGRKALFGAGSYPAFCKRCEPLLRTYPVRMKYRCTLPSVKGKKHKGTWIKGRYSLACAGEESNLTRVAIWGTCTVATTHIEADVLC
jgi:hypothetical protein